MKAAIRVLEYMVHPDDLALEFDGTKGLKVVAYSDADWDVNPSTTGYLVSSCGGAVAWKSGKQKCITLSSCEAELVAANAAGAECAHVQHLLADVSGVQVGSCVLKGDLGCDNQGAVTFASNPIMTHSRMKHVERDFLKIREWVRDKVLTMFHVPGKRNPADAFTKALCPQQFEKLRALFMARC